ncbi:hypothetical protein [Chiayiivirga flava]|uniref:Glycine zipper domain-containing protein n=1 Tax=Chiayiivirga flava TaxID=659595 RepID=A0A7W8DAA5_9GAMM|nr:hypothetical protein [Chiayiivirga flava]MBB5209670.1 hypothetical protein [Chiayiivirga flava]
MTNPSKHTVTGDRKGTDQNRDPITGTPGAHPVGVGLGGAAGGAAGAAAGAIFGPIGLLVGAAVGTLAGASAGKGVAESIDPTAEREYWRGEYANRPYVSPERDFDTHYAPAYEYGTTARGRYADRTWDAALESDLARDWGQVRGTSELDWDAAQPAVKDAWERSDRTYRTYDSVDAQYRERYQQAPYYDPAYPYEDYRQAYRYGTYARASNPDRPWNDDYERELSSGWNTARGQSRMEWDQARAAARDAWESTAPNAGPDRGDGNDPFRVR